MMKEIITTTLILFYTGVLIGQDPFNCTEEATYSRPMISIPSILQLGKRP